MIAGNTCFGYSETILVEMTTRLLSVGYESSMAAVYFLAHGLSPLFLLCLLLSLNSVSWQAPSLVMGELLPLRVLGVHLCRDDSPLDVPFGALLMRCLQAKLTAHCTL